MKTKKKKHAKNWRTADNAPVGWELISESWYDWEMIGRHSYATWVDDNGILVLVPARDVVVVDGYVDRQYCFEIALPKHLTYKLRELKKAGIKVAGLEWWVKR